MAELNEWFASLSLEQRRQLFAAAPTVVAAAAAAPAAALVAGPDPAAPRKFKTNGPVGRGAAKSFYVIPDTNEDLKDLEKAVADNQLLVYHGSRQSGKTTRMNVLHDRLVERGKKVVRVTLQAADDVVDAALDAPCDVLLVDEFDALSTGRFTPERRNSILGSIRSRHQLDPATGRACMPILLFGSFASVTRVKSDGGGSPFNSYHKLLASFFTHAEVARLFGEFAAEWNVVVPVDVVASIVAATSGHRGIVTCVGEAVQDWIERERRKVPHTDQPYVFGIEQWNSCQVSVRSRIEASAMFRHQADAIVSLGAVKGKIIALLAKVPAGDGKLLNELTSEEKRLGEELVNLGLFWTEDTGDRLIAGAPVLADMWPRMLQINTILPESCRGDTRAFLEFVVKESLPLVKENVAQGSTKTRDRPKTRPSCPSEAAYSNGFRNVVCMVLDPTTIHPEIGIETSAKDSKEEKKKKNGIKRLDFLLQLPWKKERVLVELCCHVGAKVDKNRTTVEEHRERVREWYLPCYSDAEAWVVNYLYDDVVDECVCASANGVNVLNVVHNDNLEVVEYQFGT